MSNRLHIGPSDDPIYDCVLTSLDGAKEKLAEEWMYASPYKVRIGDMALFKAAQPVLADVFADYGREWPDDVWAFYRGEERIEHPTQSELDAWCDA